VGPEVEQSGHEVPAPGAGRSDHTEDPVPDPFEQATLEAAADLDSGQAAGMGLGEGEAAVLSGRELLQEMISTPEEGVPGRTRIGKALVSQPGALGDHDS
jgi:hypothetical protein